MKLIVLSLTTAAMVCLAAPGFATESHDAVDDIDETAEEEASESSEQGEELLVTLKVPLMSPHFSSTPVAVVDEEPITVSDLTAQISSSHAGKEEKATSMKKNYTNLLERVITYQLIVQEAKNIGFDELPEIATQIEKFSSELLISNVMSPKIGAVEADPEEVQELYEKMSRELLMTALVFAREEDALAFEEEYKARDDFKDLARQYVEAGRADGAIDDEHYMKMKELRPQIAQVAFDMEPQSRSNIFSAQEGFLIFYLHDIRFYEDAAVEREALRMIREPLMKEEADEYVDYLIDEYCTVDRGLLKKVDFERQKRGFLFFRKEEPADFEKLKADERILATVHDDEQFTVTVGDLATKLEERHFHGIEKAAEKRKLNPEKWKVLRDILFRKAAVLEGQKQRLDEIEDYVDAVDDFSSTLLFSTFINKVIAPDVELNEEEVSQYYEEHIGEFSSPEMYRLDGLAFSDKKDAKSALAKLHKGADFKWVSANSAGQVDKEAKGASLFENALLSLTAMPEGLHHDVEGARAGDSLLYSVPDGYHYVISIRRVFPAQPQPYEAARGKIAKIVFDRKLKELIDYWSGELREAYDTRIFITGLGD